MYRFHAAGVLLNYLKWCSSGKSVEMQELHISEAGGEPRKALMCFTGP